MKAKTCFQACALSVALALTGCATAPTVTFHEVDRPVYSCPIAVLPVRPVEEPLASRSFDDVKRASKVRIEQWKGYALQLETLLTPYTVKQPTTPATP